MDGIRRHVEDGVLVLVGGFVGVVDCPARGEVSIDGVSDGVVILLNRGSGSDELDFLGRGGVVERSGGDFEFGEDRCRLLR